MAPSLSNLFGNSPFQALSKHSQKVHACVHLLPDLVSAGLSGQRSTVEKLGEDVFRLESEADLLRDQIYQDLTALVLLPLSRSQLFSILEHQDSIADSVEDIAAIFSYRPLALPEPESKEVRTFLDETLAVCRLAEEIFSKLILLVESSFQGRDALQISELIFQLRKQEDLTKARKIRLLRSLHQSQTLMEAIDIVYWTQVIEKLGDISKFADNAAVGIGVVLRGE